MKVVAVAVAVRHVEHRAEVAAVTGGIGALVQAHVLDGFRIENGKEPECVRGIVEGYLIEKDLGLIGTAAPDVQAAADVRRCLDARKELQAAQQVGFPDGGQLLQYRGLEGDETGLGQALVSVSIRLDHGFLADQHGRCECHVPPKKRFSAETQRVPVRLVSEV